MTDLRDVAGPWHRDSADNGYTLADLDSMRGGFGLYSYQEHFAPPPPRARGRRIRFWASDAEGNGLRLVEGTLGLGEIGIKHLGDGITEYTLTGHLFPQIVQMLVPDEISFDLEEPIKHELQPVEPLVDDMVTAEIDLKDQGFQTIGFIDPDGLKIETNTDYIKSFGGQTVKTREDITVEFSTVEFNPEVMEMLLRP